MLILPPAYAFRQKRPVLGFPEAALLRSAVLLNGLGWLEPLPDLSASDISEQIARFMEADGGNSGLQGRREENAGRSSSSAG